MLWRTEGPVELALRLEGGPDLSQARHTSRVPHVAPTEPGASRLGAGSTTSSRGCASRVPLVTWRCLQLQHSTLDVRHYKAFVLVSIDSTAQARGV